MNDTNANNAVNPVYYQDDDDEATIDLGCMFAHLLRKWKPILVLAVVCCIVVGFLGAYKSRKDNENAYSDQTLAGLTQYMTSSEIQNVTQLYNRYRAMQQKIADNEEYNSHSVLMKMDPNLVSQVSVEYSVKSDNQAVASSFNLFSLDYDDYKKMADVMGDGYDPMYMYEIVTISPESVSSDGSVSATDGDSYSVDLDKASDSSKGTVTRENNSLFTVSVKTNSEDQCRKIAEIVDEAIQNHYEKLKDAGVNLTLTQVDSTYTEQMDQSLADLQQQNITKGSDLYAEYADFETNTIAQLSDEEKSLYDFYVNKNDNKIERPHTLRYFAIGGLAGLAAGIIIFIIQYLAKSGFHTEDDVIRATGLKTVGTIIEEDKKSRGLNRFFIRHARAIENRALPDGTEEEQIRSACARIIAVCRTNGLDSLYLIKGFASKHGDEVADIMREKIGNHITKVSSGSPAFSADDLKELEGTKAAVVLTSIESSKLYTIRENLSACEDCGVNVLGNVIIKEN